MTRSTLFTNNRSQAVRLPKAVAFPPEVEQVDVIIVGNSRILTPVGRRWDDFFLNGPATSADFMSDRDQGEERERESL